MQIASPSAQASASPEASGRKDLVVGDADRKPQTSCREL
jgi:hypothetical protein